MIAIKFRRVITISNSSRQTQNDRFLLLYYDKCTVIITVKLDNREIKMILN
jgi:hypothetical protein